MNRYLTILIIIISFAIFSVFDIMCKSSHKVIAVKDAATVVVDFNNNGITDENEYVCIPDIEVFSGDFKLNQNELAEKYKINEEVALAVGYFGKQFAEDTLLNKNVKIKFTSKRDENCRHAKIIVDNKDYKKLLVNSGFALMSKPIPPDLLKKAQKLHLVIFNHKSSKYHSVTCKYGQAAFDAVLMPKKDLPDNAAPCKFCIIEKAADKHAYENIPLLISNLNIKILLTDFTKKLKPDNKCDDNICKTLLKEINNSTHSIDIAAYGWENNHFLNSAIQKAVSRGVKVRLVYDTNAQNTSFYPYTFEFARIIKNSRSDIVANNRKETNYLMHNKFIIFDREKVFTGSANFSNTGLSGYNANSVFIINSKQIAEIYTEEFEQMYNGKFHNGKNKGKNNSTFRLNNTKIRVFFMPQEKGVTDGVIPIINEAKSYIYIPAFLITHRTMATALINAKKRGVDVKIILDATNASNKSSMHQILRNNGIQVKTENYAGKMHIKSMISDDKYIIGGSMNFSYSGENRNDENMIIIEDRRLAVFFKDYFMYLWDKIPDKWLKYNARAESFDSIGSCSDGIDNDFDGKIDMYDEGCMKK